MNEIIRDNGLKSRKLWFSVFSIVAIFAGGIAAARWAGIAPIYSTMVGGILGVVSAYLTGNVVQKWVGAKAPMDSAATTEEQAKPPAARFAEDPKE